MTLSIKKIPLFFALLLFFSFAGCGKGEEKLLSSLPDTSLEEKEPYYSFTDDLGNEIVLWEKPQKIAVLFSSFAEVWQLSGGETAITVGESVERGFAGADVLLVDSGAGKTIDNETLIDAELDFVICSSDLDAQTETAGLLNSAGIPAACFHVEDFADYLRMLKICTDITKNSEAYDQYGLQVQQEIQTLLASLSLPEEPIKVLFIRSGSSSSSAKAKTAKDNFVCRMLEEIGLDNIADNAPVLLDGLSIEEVLEQDPDYLFISTMGNEEAAKAYMDSVLAEPAWQGLSAVAEGRYSYLPKDLFQYKPNARWAEAYRYLAELVYGQ